MVTGSSVVLETVVDEVVVDFSVLVVVVGISVVVVLVDNSVVVVSDDWSVKVELSVVELFGNCDKAREKKNWNSHKIISYVAAESAMKESIINYL